MGDVIFLKLAVRPGHINIPATLSSMLTLVVIPSQDARKEMFESVHVWKKILLYFSE